MEQNNSPSERAQTIAKPGVIPRFYAEMLVAFCAAQGHEQSKLLNAAGLTETEWHLGYDLTPTQFGRIYQRALWLMGDESLGMVGGHAVPNGSFRVLCLCTAQCHTLGDALQRSADFCEVAIGYSVKPVISRMGVTARVDMQSTLHGAHPIDISTSPVQLPLMLLIWVNFISWLIGQPLPVSKVLVQSRPGRDDAHERFFDCDVQYHASRSGLEFPGAVLGWPVNRTEADVAYFLDDALATLISPRLTSSSWTKRVMSIIADAGHGKPPDSSAIAHQLNVSRATLRRRLAGESTSVQLLKDQHRCNAAMRYLASSALSLKAIGLRCGFDNPGDFNRAFRRWSGQTPGQYRASLQSSQSGQEAVD